MKDFLKSVQHEIAKSERALNVLIKGIKSADSERKDELRAKKAHEKAYLAFFKNIEEECNLLGESHGIALRCLILVGDEFSEVDGVARDSGTSEARGKTLQLVMNYLLR